MNSLKLAALGALALAGTCGVASAQNMPDGRVYAFHSGPQGNCPGLDWHVVAQGDNLTGMIFWGNMQHMAKVSGSINAPNRTFEMTADEVGGQARAAKIDGTVESSGWLVANIDGPGVKCKKVNVRWFVDTPNGGG